MEKALKIQILIGLLAAVFIAGSATAGLMPIPPDPKIPAASLPGSSLGVLGFVDSYVYQYTSGTYAGQYLYTYQLTSTSMGISFFSVGVDDTLNLTLNIANYEPGGVSPSAWGPVGDPLLLLPLQSVDAGFFVTPIYSGQASALLWFISDYAPMIGTGSAFGTSAGVPTFRSAPLYTIPEPATIIMLTTGALWGCIRRRKHTV